MTIKNKSFYFCRTAKQVVPSLAMVKDDYMLIDETCKIGEYKNGDPVTVRSDKDAREFARIMGWSTPIHSASKNLTFRI
jgi:hypothetical protein